MSGEVGIGDLLATMRLKGIKVWAENGRLRYLSLSGTPSATDLQTLKARRAEIMEYVQQAGSDAHEPPLLPRRSDDSIPLTFSQRMLLNRFRQARRHGTRSVFTAVRLLGWLHVEVLRASLTELVARHESLRTRIIAAGDDYTQSVDPPQPYELSVSALDSLPQQDREAAAAQIVTSLVRDPVDISRGPLFIARLVRLSAGDHVLVLAMDHLISDGASVGILLRDLWTLYSQSASGRPHSLPNMPVQYADYCVWQDSVHRSWPARHERYWRDQLTSAPRLRMFAEEEHISGGRGGFAIFPVQLERALSSSLRDRARREQTTLALSVLSLCVALAARWCNTADVVVPFVTMGRQRPEVQNTVGCFGAPLFLRIGLKETDTFADCLRRVTGGYATACEHYDSGKFASQWPRPDCALNPAFNWFPKEFELHPAAFTAFAENSVMEDLSDSIRVSAFQLKTPLSSDVGDDAEWCAEPELRLWDSEDGVGGAIVYRPDRVQLSTLARFSKDFRTFAEHLANRPSAQLAAARCEHPSQRGD